MTFTGSSASDARRGDGGYAAPGSNARAISHMTSVATATMATLATRSARARFRWTAGGVAGWIAGWIVRMAG